MLHIKKVLNFYRPLIKIKNSNKQIDIIDSSYIYYQLNRDNFSIKNRTLIQKDSKVHHHAKGFDISNDSLHIYPKKGAKSLLFIKKNSDQLKVVSSLNFCQNVVITKFSNNSKMAIIGGDNGALWLYDTDFKRVIYKFPSRSDEISSIIFSEDDSMVAISSYDKKIEILDTKKWILLYETKFESVVESVEFSKQNLYTVHKDGTISCIDLKKREVIYSKNIGSHWFTTIKRYKSLSYALIGARDNSFMVVELKRARVIKKLTLRNKGLNSVDFTKDELIMAFADGNMVVCDMGKNRDDLLVSLKMENYTKAKEILDTNPLLYLDGTAEEFYSYGKKALEEIIKLIELNKIEDAVKTAEPFLDNEDFNIEFESYMACKKEITNFINSIKSKDLATAYKLSSEFEYIKKLKKYQDLEEYWSRAFNQAKALIAKNPNDSSAKIRAKGKLQSFLNVSCKKDAIKNLLENSMLFFKADSLAKEKRFQEFFSLCEKYTFLQNTKVYNNVMAIADLLLTNVTKAIQSKEYENAKMTIKKLLNFTPIKSEVTSKLNEIEAIEKFINRVEKKEYSSALELIKECKILESLPEYTQILKEFESSNKRAKIYALDGDIYNTYETLYEYLKINYFKDQIAFTLKVAYINSMEPSKYKSPIEWEKTFLNYTQLYGKDSQLLEVATQNGIVDLFHSLKHDEDDKGYKKREFKKEVVVLKESV